MRAADPGALLFDGSSTASHGLTATYPRCAASFISALRTPKIRRTVFGARAAATSSANSWAIFVLTAATFTERKRQGRPA